MPNVHHLCIVQDLMTDLKARAEHLPLDEARYRHDWLGHRVSIHLCHYSTYKLLVRQCFVFVHSSRATRDELVYFAVIQGIIKSAVNVRDKLLNGRLLERALNSDPVSSCFSYASC